MKRSLLWAFIVTCVVALAACTTGAYLSAASNSDAAITGGVVASGQDISLTNFKTRMVGGVMNAVVTVTNTSMGSSTKNISYKFTWFDKDGFPTGGDTPWQPLSVATTNPQQLVGVAPNTQAVLCRINIHIMN